MSTLGWIILALIVGYAVGENIGKHSTYKEVVLECRRLGGFFYGRTVIKCASVEDLPEIAPHPMPSRSNPMPPPTKPAPPMPHIPQPKPETRG